MCANFRDIVPHQSEITSIKERTIIKLCKSSIFTYILLRL